MECNEVYVKLEYALTYQDIVLNELGCFERIRLDKAIKLAEGLLRRKYVMVKITRIDGG